MAITPLTFPVLTQDDTRMDWRMAKYMPSIRVQHNRAFIANKLVGAPELESLILNGLAEWAVDVRCPKTLYARTEYHRDNDFEIRWDIADTDGPVYLRAGLVARTNLRIPASGLLAAIWGDSDISLPQGWWLAQSRTVTSKTLAESLLTFRKDEKLESGTMAAEEDRGTGNLRFIIRVAPDIFDYRLTDRDIHMAGLIAAFGLLGKKYGNDQSDEALEDADEEPGNDLVLLTLKNRLEDADIPTWDDVDYDPARAATAIEQFRVIADNRDNDD